MSDTTIFQFEADKLEALIVKVQEYLEANIEAELIQGLKNYKDSLLKNGKRFMGLKIRDYTPEEINKIIDKVIENPSYKEAFHYYDYSVGRSHPYWRAKSMAQRFEDRFFNMSIAAEVSSSFMPKKSNIVFVPEYYAARLVFYTAERSKSPRFKEYELTGKINLDLDANY